MLECVEPPLFVAREFHVKLLSLCDAMSLMSKQVFVDGVYVQSVIEDCAKCMIRYLDSVYYTLV